MPSARAGPQPGGAAVNDSATRRPSSGYLALGRTSGPPIVARSNEVRDDTKSRLTWGTDGFLSMYRTNSSKDRTTSHERSGGSRTSSSKGRRLIVVLLWFALEARSSPGRGPGEGRPQSPGDTGETPSTSMTTWPHGSGYDPGKDSLLAVGSSRRGPYPGVSSTSERNSRSFVDWSDGSEACSPKPASSASNSTPRYSVPRSTCCSSASSDRR
jgi:hypothetical protein